MFLGSSALGWIVLSDAEEKNNEKRGIILWQSFQ